MHQHIALLCWLKSLSTFSDAMPVEIVQFCWKYNLERLQNLPEVAGCVAKLRMDGDKPYVTDNSNYIVDLYFEVRTDVTMLIGVCSFPTSLAPR